MGSEGEGLIMMIVEDNDFQRAVAAKVLEDLGCKAVLSAADGQDALEQIVAHPDKINIVISDLDMPGMDGVEMMRHLAEQKLSDAMVIASALDAALIHTVEDMAQEHGIQVLTNISKPINREKICAVLEQYRKEQKVRNPDAWAGKFSAEDIQQGLDNAQFKVWYQPKVRMEDGSWVCSEALARWEHPEQGVVLPGQFIPEMEKTGLIEQLTWQQFHVIAEDLYTWQQQGKDLSVAINISPGLLEDTDMPRKLEEILNHYHISPARLILEITESVMMRNMARSLETLARLRLMGFSLSIDDFGTGFSSQQQLNRIPFTELKIDQCFVRDMHKKSSSMAIVESNIELARKLNLQTVAEGLESVEDWNTLSKLHCDLAQGFVIARPMPKTELPVWEQGWQQRYRAGI